jgi:hypothetical protein
VTPEEALQLAKTVSDIYATATADLLSLIARATAKGLDRPDWAEKQLAQILPLRREAQRIVARMQTSGPAEIQRLVGEVYAAQARPTGGTAVNPRTVTALAADTVGRISTLSPRVLRTTEDIYRSVVAETLATASTGSASRRQAAAAALDRFSKAGIGGFTDSAGRQWTLDTYTEMATRTALGRAHLAGTLQQYADEGREWVIVSNSPEECPQCRPYEGRILSLNGLPPPLSPGFEYAGTLDEAISHGLHHPNCTHRTSPFLPGLTKPLDDTENPDGYQLRQRQRDLERRVRESKRRVAATRPLGDTPTGRAQEALLRRRQGDLDSFIRDNDRKAWVSRQRTQIPGGLPPKPRTAPPPRTPPASPVSAAIHLPNGTQAFKAKVQAGLDAIDKVHDDGVLPLIDVKSSRMTEALGFYTPSSPGINVQAAGPWPALTAVHEIGHFLDHKAIGGSRTLTTTQSPIPGPLGAVIDTAARSDLFAKLDAFDLAALAPSQRKPIVGHIRYLKSAPEVWARAYAQWVALRSGSPLLAEEMAVALDSGRRSGLVRQWEADDFEPIAQRIDDLMRDLGWI